MMRIQRGNNNTGRAGLGFVKSNRTWTKRASARDARKQIALLVKEQAQHDMAVSVQHLLLQNVWIKWVDAGMKGDLTWNKMMFQYSERLTQFVIKAQLNALPSPDNLKRWHLHADAHCKLCGMAGATLTHILCNC